MLRILTRGEDAPERLYLLRQRKTISDRTLPQTYTDGPE
jgi:hypothetical protein